MAQAAAKKPANGKKDAPKSKAALELEAAKQKFEEAQKKLAEKKASVTKAKRTLASGEKKVQVIQKKIEEEKEKPNKAVEILQKKTEEMLKQAEAIEKESGDILKKAEEMETEIEKATEELEEAKEEAKKKMEELGVSTRTTTRTAATGTAAERRAKNNFQYRLKTKGWVIDYNLKNRIQGAKKHGLYVLFDDKEFVVSPEDDRENVLLKHEYGSGSLTALADCVKEHGDGGSDD